MCGNANSTIMIRDKKIIFISPEFFNIEKIIIDRLEKNNNLVLYCDERPFKAPIKKAINSFFPRLFSPSAYRYFKHKLEKCSFAPDVILVVKGEQIGKKTINLMRRKYPHAKLILYLWDSISCIKGITSTISLYDKVLSFDRRDCLQYGFSFRPLFCDIDKVHETCQEPTYDLCFYGTMHTDRFSVLTKINEESKKLGLKIVEFCYLPSKFMRFYYWITNRGYRRFDKKLLSFRPKNQDEISELIGNSKAILDINDKKQSGLTIRTLESLFAQKKIITTNSDIREYDFYNESSILIIDRTAVEIPSSFFERSSERALSNSEFYSKYSAEGWIEDVFKDL